MIQNDTAITTALAPTPSSLKHRRSASLTKATTDVLTALDTRVSEPVRPRSTTPTPSTTAAALTPPKDTPRSATPVSIATDSAPAQAALPEVQADTRLGRLKQKLLSFGWFRAAQRGSMVVRDWTREPMSWESVTRPIRFAWNSGRPLGAKISAAWKNPNVRATVYGVAATALAATAIVGIALGTGGILVLPALALGGGLGLGFASVRAFFRARRDAANAG